MSRIWLIINLLILTYQQIQQYKHGRINTILYIVQWVICIIVIVLLVVSYFWLGLTIPILIIMQIWLWFTFIISGDFDAGEEQLVNINLAVCTVLALGMNQQIISNFFEKYLKIAHIFQLIAIIICWTIKCHGNTGFQ